MGENRKAVNAILRKNAERIERANKRAVTCPNPTCKTRIEGWWNFCAECGLQLAAVAGDPLPSTVDRPFGCPPDEEAK